MCDLLDVLAPSSHLSFPFGEHLEFGLCEHGGFLLELRLQISRSGGGVQGCDITGKIPKADAIEQN